MSLFTDSEYVYSSFTPEFTGLRVTYIPLEGPFTGQPVLVAGWTDLEGDGYTREGVNPVYPADGSGEPAKQTKGRFKANEITIKHFPEVFRKEIEPKICPKGQLPNRFNVTIQQVDPAGVATWTEVRVDCITTGVDYERPSGGEAFSTAHKFSPKKHR